MNALAHGALSNHVTETRGRPNIALMALLAKRPAPAPDADASALFDALYHAELAWVFRTLRRLGAREADLEDLTHDVFVAAFRALASFDRARPPRPWLFGIAFRVVSDYRARARFQREVASDRLDEFAPAATGTTESESELDEAQARALLLRALDTLPLDQRAVYVASELDETPMPVLAEHLGLSVNTLYSRLRLARTRVAAAVQALVTTGAAR